VETSESLDFCNRRGGGKLERGRGRSVIQLYRLSICCFSGLLPHGNHNEIGIIFDPIRIRPASKLDIYLLQTILNGPSVGRSVRGVLEYSE
jgi:hypothetical protein